MTDPLAVPQARTCALLNPVGEHALEFLTSTHKYMLPSSSLGPLAATRDTHTERERVRGREREREKHAEGGETGRG